MVLLVIYLVQGEATLELCLTPYWSDVRDAYLNLSIVFHSLQPSTTELTFVSVQCVVCMGYGFSRFTLAACWPHVDKS